MKPSNTLVMACMTTAFCHATPLSVNQGFDATANKRQSLGEMAGGASTGVDGEGIAKGVLGIVGNALDIAKTAEPLLEGLLSGSGHDAPADGEGSGGGSAEESGHGSGGSGNLLNGLGGGSDSGADAAMNSTSTKLGLDKQQLSDIVNKVAAHLETTGKQDNPKETRDVELTERQSGALSGSGIAKGVLGIIDSAFDIARAAGAPLPNLSAA